MGYSRVPSAAAASYARSTDTVHLDLGYGRSTANTRGRSADVKEIYFSASTCVMLPLERDNSTSALAAMAIIANASIGAGALNFPAAFADTGGLPVGIPILLVCCLLTVMALAIAGVALHVSDATDYFQAIRYFMGPAIEAVSQILLIVNNFGACVLYLIIIGDQSEEVSRRVVGEEYFCAHWWARRELFMPLISLTLIFPLMLVRSVDFLKWPSLVSVASMLYVMALVTCNYIVQGPNPDAVISHSPRPWYSVFDSFPTLLYGYQCISNACPVYANLRSQSMSSWAVVVVGAVGLCTVVYLPIAAFGYLSNGDHVASNILLEYPSSSNWALLAQVGVLASVTMTYPVIYFIIASAMDSLFVNSRLLLDEYYDPTPHADRRRYTIAAAFYAVSLVTALLVPDIGPAVDFAGSTAAFFFFIFPGMFLIKMTYMREFDNDFSTCAKMASRVVASVLVILGFFLFGQGLAASVNGIITPSSSSSSLCQ